MPSPSPLSRKSISFSSSGYASSSRLGALRGEATNDSAGVLTGIRFYFTGGNIASGTFKLYGVAALMQRMTINGPVELNQEEIEEIQAERLAIAANLRENIWQQIKQERDKRTSEGGYKVNTKWFHSDLISRSQQIALALGGFIPAGLMWKTMDGTFVEMNSTLAQQVFQAAVQSDNNIFGHAEVLKSQVMASNDPSSIDIYSGWPVAFWEE